MMGGSMALYVLASAVNLPATIFDGNDLSVIRGSSARLLQASEDLFRHLKGTFEAAGIEVDRLSVGASELLVRLAATPPVPAPLAAPAPLSGTRWRNARDALVAKVEAGSPLDRAVDGWLAGAGLTDPAGSRASVVSQIEAELGRRAARGRPAEREVDEAVKAFFAQPTQTKLRHFSFSHVCHRPVGGERLCDILAALFSKLRIRQMQALRLSPPPIVTPLPPASKAFCALTLRQRPATPGAEVRGQPASISAAERRTNGRRQKQWFYEAQLRRSKEAARALSDVAAEQRLNDVLTRLQSTDLDFAQDFEAIVANPPDDTMAPNVRNKFAVLFMDGNNFGACRTSSANVDRGNGYDNNASHAAYRDFCLALERNGGLIVAGLVDWMLNQGEWFLGTSDTGERYLRFETLLFGGDDICFVFPAWGAFALMARLQEILAALAAPVAGNRQPLTFKAGMVIADRKSPIRDLRHVAEELAVAAKKTAGDRNVVQVAVLEGLDRAELDPSVLRSELFGKVPDGIRGIQSLDGGFGLEGSRWAHMCFRVREIGTAIGRSQLHKWYALAEIEGVLRVPEINPPDVHAQWNDFVARREAFTRRFAEGLLRLEVQLPLREILTGSDPLLAAGAQNWPLLPLHHVLTLADYIEAVPLAAPAASVAA